MTRNIAMAFCLVLAAGCNKDNEASAPPDPSGASDPVAADGTEPTDDATPPAWPEMSHEQKITHMKTEVMPTMKAVFQGFSAEHFADFTCATCHGPGASEGQFEMPSPALPKLPPNGEFEPLMKEKPEIMNFMFEVGPKMAASLGVEPYNPETHEGFGCYGCHQTQ